MKKCLSSDRLEAGDVDAYSDVSSERSFSYEFAQAEVMMKGLGNNGESDCDTMKNGVSKCARLTCLKHGGGRSTEVQILVLRNTLKSEVLIQLLYSGKS